MTENPADDDPMDDDPMDDVPGIKKNYDDGPIIGGPSPIQLVGDDIKRLEVLVDDEPSEFGDDDALLSVAEDVEPSTWKNGLVVTKDITSSYRTDKTQSDSHTDITQGRKSSHKMSGSNNHQGSSGKSPPGSTMGSSTSDSQSGITGIRSAEVRKTKTVVPITSEPSKMMMNHHLVRKSLENLSDFSLLDGLLVGRDTEVSQLKSCFDRMVESSSDGGRRSNSDGSSDGAHRSSSLNFRVSNKELILIKGIGGIGKSVIARTLKDEIGDHSTGIFVEGKFDMNSTDEPYSGIAGAYGKICQHIQTKMPEAIPNVQKALEQDLGNEVRLMIQLISDLKDLVNNHQSDEGAPKHQSDIHTAAIQNNGLERMRYAFRVLTRVFSQECSPMIIFLDDLHWADISSLQMIDFLLTDTHNPNPLMIIGCYRSDEVDENSLLYNKIAGIREKSDKHGFSMTEMEIGPFQVQNIEEVITKTMPCDDKNECHKLAELCLKRTLGNVFFVLEFLRMLQLEGLVECDQSTHIWSWDLGKIEEATMSTANVAMLLQERMWKLPDQVQSFLQCAAYLGSTFSVTSISAVWNTYGRRLTKGKMEQAPALLDMILAKDFVEKYGARHYRWVHDKIQEAALTVRPIRESFHLDIGTSLYYTLDPLELEEDLFTVLDLINTGNVFKRPEYAEANLRGAQKAMSVSAYQAAATYASHGIELLEKNEWVEHRALAIRLYTISAETAVILGNFELAERSCQEVLGRDEVSYTEKLPLKLIKERALSAQMYNAEALEYSLELLKELGCDLFRRKVMVPVQAIRKSLAAIKKSKKLSKESYNSMSKIDDRKQRAVAQLLARVANLSLNDGNFLLSQLATCKMIDMTLEQGIHEGSAVGLATLSLLVVSVFRDYETGFKFAETAMHLIERFENLRNGEAIVMAYLCAMPCKLSLEACRPHFYVAYTECLRMGDTENGCWGLINYEVTLRYQLGRPLNDILADCPALVLNFEESSHALPILMLRVFNQMLLNLKKVASNNDSSELEGDVFSKNNESEIDKAVTPTILLAEGELSFFSGHYVAAAQRALKIGGSYEKATGGYFLGYIEIYHRAAALYAAAIQTRKRKFKSAAKKLRNNIDKREKSGNPNLKYYVMHLNAEQAVLDKKFDDGDKMYKDAIESVTSFQHLHHCGFIRERYADFLERDRGMVDESKKWLKESIEFYKEWGAEGRVTMLESRL